MLIHLIKKKLNKLKDKCYLSSSRMAPFVMLCYKVTDTQSIKSGHVRTTVMHDCMQQKEITVFHAKSIDL